MNKNSRKQTRTYLGLRKLFALEKRTVRKKYLLNGMVMINHLIHGFPLMLKFENKTPDLTMYPVGTGTPPQRVFTLSGSELYPTYSQIQRVKL